MYGTLLFRYSCRRVLPVCEEGNWADEGPKGDNWYEKVSHGTFCFSHTFSVPEDSIVDPDPTGSETVWPGRIRILV